MTEASYQEKLLRGLTGPGTSTCVCAGLDRRSLYHSVCDNCYRDQQAVMDYYDGHGITYVEELPPEWQLKHRNVQRHMLRDVGVLRPWQIVERRLNHLREVETLLGKASIGGFRVLVDLSLKEDNGIEVVHTVAVMPTQDLGCYRLLSTATGFEGEDDEVFSAQDIADNLYRPSGKVFKKDASRETNTWVLPPELRPRDTPSLGIKTVDRRKNKRKQYF